MSRFTLPRTVPSSPVLALALALAGTLAACNGGASPSPSGPVASGPLGSGSAACPTAASVPDDLEGWGPPATAPTITPVLIASPGQLVCGPNRVLFTFTDATGRPVGAPDRTASLALYDLASSPTTPIATVQGTFVWAIEDKTGIYITNVTFPEAGRYGAEFVTEAPTGEPETIRLTFDVQPTSAVVKVGDKAPASKTPTLADAGGDATKLSTDANPDPQLYETSVDRAIADHKPFVLIFATPKFCTSQQCGPTLDRIKPFIAQYPSVTFINVEPYKLKLVDGVLTADVDANNQLQTTAVTDGWHLFNEPAVYVVDKTGTVTASFELIFSDDELTTALDAVK
ncbi:MAG TPA: hypothetical protein VM451_04035 [Candidatus Limnocylindria bacterium]|nr:hypothetical protein [Candidatus Limnocylindria bacterium]